MPHGSLGNIPGTAQASVGRGLGTEVVNDGGDGAELRGADLLTPMLSASPSV